VVAGAADLSAVVTRRAVEERLVQRGGEVLEVEHGDEGDEGERERVRPHEGAPAPPAAVLRLPHSRLGKPQPPAFLPASSNPRCCYPRARFFFASHLAARITRCARRRCDGGRDRLI
jgi:hypothetical protein